MARASKQLVHLFGQARPHDVLAVASCYGRPDVAVHVEPASNEWRVRRSGKVVWVSTSGLLPTPLSASRPHCDVRRTPDPPWVLERPPSC